jgi:hypothetical protein
MKWIVNNKNIMRAQSADPRTKLYAYKAFKVLKPGVGLPPVHDGKKRYKLRPGTVIKQDQCNSDPFQDCGIGLHVCTMEWACDFWVNYERIDMWRPLQIWKVEFGPLDIGCVPFERVEVRRADGSLESITDQALGKFRVRRFKLVKRVRWGKSNP